MNNTFTISTEGAQADIAVVRIQGFLGTVVTYSLQEQIYELIDTGTYKYIIDLEGLKQLGSAGIGLFSGLVMELRKHNGQLVLLHVPESVEHVLKSTRLIELFTMGEDLEQAIVMLDSGDRTDEG